MNKKIFAGILVFLITCSTVIATTNLESTKPTYGTTTDTVNFRSMATTSSYVIRKLAKGTSVKILGTLNSFYIVQLGTNEVGLVYSSYVKSSSSAPSGASTYTQLGKLDGIINSNNVNFRRGASTSFDSISKLKYNSTITVIGEINNWYVVVNDENTVGAIYKQYVTLKSNNTNTSNENNTTDSNVQLILNLINEARQKNGVGALKLGATLPTIAQLKAEDMVKNNYFSHTSPTYGTPFKMMQDYGIDYLSAGENIAGNPDIASAVKSWLASDTHKQNILSSAYEYVGIGVAKSNTYGYVISVMFVG